ncbi:hypothetical protein XM38_002100 [Halomicronema hongdechloris C2206]|uniref:Sulfotransferase n=1 Tax=Halomicronema hongdechloris C2206 TaxID=1641165 RepID=A0A1Z3HG54_9CYAN|nr:sulfotransferase [Halomicronema hongdechloris]ASC69283.1 hypothetical protein XM38_002100 [Halomicronema hongdechloris C2206]
MKLPNFLIIGVQKAGTSSVYHYLKGHPQVYMSPIKEPNFLMRDWQSDPTTRVQRNKGKIRTLEAYCQLFQASQDEVAIGEASPNYLFHYQSAADQIQKYVPQAKLICILRNPVDRAYSDYLMHLRDAIHDKPRSLSEQIRYRAQQSFIIRKGFYYAPLKHFYTIFGREQLRVYLYDDLCESAVDFMQEIYRFLEVDSSFRPDVSRKAQVAQVPQNQWLNKLLRRENRARRVAATILRPLMSPQARHRLRAQLLNLNSKDKSQEPLRPEDRQQLIELYREDILKLQDLVHRDLSSWLT